MYFKLTKFLIIGISKSGYNACKRLLELQSKCYIYDENMTDSIKKLMDELAALGAVILSKDNVRQKIEEIDVVVLSPAVPIDNELSVMARKLKKNVIGEIELASYFINSPIIAVTGTNGKTTTCSMVYHIFNHEGERAHLLGNIGTPLSSKGFQLTYDDVAVVEVSSFQLETTARFAPHIACILNISPDHLSRHYNMENYIYLKGKILQNLRESEFAILNFDDEIVRNFSSKTRAKVYYFSAQAQVNGAYLLNDSLFWMDEPIIKTDKLRAKGMHNILNALAAICICKVLGVKNESIVAALSEFEGITHRQQEVCVVNDIKYINDSKATNPDSTLKAINNLDRDTIVLIGGSDKGSGYELLFDQIANSRFIKTVVLFGASCDRLYSLARERGVKNINVVKQFDNAVNFAFLLAKSGNAVLLSPACSSFDEFDHFEERGDRFIKLVEQNTGKSINA